MRGFIKRRVKGTRGRGVADEMLCLLEGAGINHSVLGSRGLAGQGRWAGSRSLSRADTVYLLSDGHRHTDPSA